MRMMRGFNLADLAVVIALLCLLAVPAFIKFYKQRERANNVSVGVVDEMVRAEVMSPVVTAKADYLLQDLGYSTRVSDAEVERMNDEFVDVRVEVPLDNLTDEEQQYLRLVIKAADVIDRLFWKQASDDGLKIWTAMTDLIDRGDFTKVDYGIFRLLSIHYGRYNRVSDNHPFIGTGEKPLGATFYPPDLTKPLLDLYLNTHPDQKASILDWYTVVQKEATGLLKSVPYSEAYMDDLREAAGLLQIAANFADTESQHDFLLARAGSFLTNNYRDGDQAWVLADSKFPIVIGPTEQYEDGLVNAKAAAEAYVMVVDQKLSDELSTIKAYLPDMEKGLPLPAEYRRYKQPKIPPIVAVDLLYSTGDGKRGYQTSAFNLPNDEWVGANVGTRKVMFRNIMAAKYKNCVSPIARVVLRPTQVILVEWDVYFRHALHHELMHALGPGLIEVSGQETTVRAQLQDLAGAFEECKADLLGYWSVEFLVNAKYYDQDWLEKVSISSLVNFYRSIRFGTEEAHGKGQLMIYNHLKADGVYEYNAETGEYAVNTVKFFASVAHMAQELMILQAKGDYAGAKAFAEKYAVVTPEMKAVVERINDQGVPVDLRPIYVTAEQFRL